MLRLDTSDAVAAELAVAVMLAVAGCGGGVTTDVPADAGLPGTVDSASGGGGPPADSSDGPAVTIEASAGSEASAGVCEAPAEAMVLARGQVSVGSLAVDRANLYWTESTLPVLAGRRGAVRS
jgi:hypothetical protein